MTNSEAQAWAVNVFGGRGFAHVVSTRNGSTYTVGQFTGANGFVSWQSRHSYETAFVHAKKPVDMNHPAILRVSLVEAMAKHEKSSQAEQVELFA